MSTLTPHNKVPLSIRVSAFNVDFLKERAETEKKPLSKTADEAFDCYRKYLLWKEIREGFSKQTDEDVKEAMEGFGDYLHIIEREENDHQ